MTVTNTSEYGQGIDMSNAKVELFDVALKECTNNAYAINMRGSKSNNRSTLVAARCDFTNNFGGVSVKYGIVRLTDCTIKRNKYFGIFAEKSDVHLHGEATAIANNTRCGIYACGFAKILIHLPSHHNTIYNNGEEDRDTEYGDRQTVGGATITNVED